MPHSAEAPRRRRRKLLRLALAGSAALALAGSAALALPAHLAWQRRSQTTLSFDDDGTAMEEDAAFFHRVLYEADPSDPDYSELQMPSWVREASSLDAFEAGLAAAESSAPPIVRYPNPTSYTMEDVADASRRFSNTFGLFVYDNEADTFLFMYSNKQNWVSGNAKLSGSFQNFAFMLRRSFPERFCGKECDEFAVGIGSGDYPHLSAACLANFPHISDACPEALAPVLQFGSVFRHAEILPNMIAMPMPETHNLHCFKSWILNGGTAVCNAWLPKEYGLEFEDLAPQVVWRGTDFGYLTHITSDSLRTPYFHLDILDNLEEAGEEGADADDKAAAGTQAMRASYDHLLPRWKGVVLTAEAGQEAAQTTRKLREDGGDDAEEALPWADIKFTGPSVADKHPAAYDKFAEYGVPAIGGRMSLDDLAKRRYQIDLGGGGGTTWSGTIQKMALPSLLFHHLTPTKDYIHDHFIPWVHYVPVAADLSDLKEKYEWAEAHPGAAAAIAAKGSDLMRKLGTVEGFGEMFEQDFTEPLRRVLGAYRPVKETHPGMEWKEALEAMASGEFRTHRICDGTSPTKRACNF